MIHFPTRAAFAAAFAAAAISGAALADGRTAPEEVLAASYADPSAVVVAVKAAFLGAGREVRAAVYSDAESFLEVAAMKQRGTVDGNGVAILPFRGLEPGDYAFVVYLDMNGDGKLNRGGVLGKPKEPVVFSNGVKPKLRRPRFDEVKVEVEPGAVVELTLEE